jgi:sulfatase maturation enzyme AslB (radical SAM superfamily)
MSNVNKIRCLRPFTNLTVHRDGNCYTCCQSWTIAGTVGKLSKENTIMDIWNNQKIQAIRKAIINDNLYKVCDMRGCPTALRNEMINLKSYNKKFPKNEEIVTQIMNGNTRLFTAPVVLTINSSNKCNLNCIMCRSNHKTSKNDEEFDKNIYSKIIPNLLPQTKRIILCGNGEVFFNANSRKFLQQFDPSKYPDLKFNLLPNGTLLTPALWETISHNKYETIHISIDAAVKATYEKIRKNGNWDVLIKNLEFIGKLKEQGIFRDFRISFVVMKSNYKEMKKFVELGLRIGASKILFTKIYGYAKIEENINFTKNFEIMREIGLILRDPIFNRKEVDILLLKEYMTKFYKNSNLLERLFSRIKQTIYMPLSFIYNNIIYVPPVFIDVYNFFKRRNI